MTLELIAYLAGETVDASAPEGVERARLLAALKLAIGSGGEGGDYLKLVSETPQTVDSDVVLGIGNQLETETFLEGVHSLAGDGTYGTTIVDGVYRGRLQEVQRPEDVDLTIGVIGVVDGVDYYYYAGRPGNIAGPFAADEFEWIEQIEIGSEALHLNSNSIDRPTADVGVWGEQGRGKFHYAALGDVVKCDWIGEVQPNTQIMVFIGTDGTNRYHKLRDMMGDEVDYEAFADDHQYLPVGSLFVSTDGAANGLLGIVNGNGFWREPTIPGLYYLDITVVTTTAPLNDNPELHGVIVKEPVND